MSSWLTSNPILDLLKDDVYYNSNLKYHPKFVELEADMYVSLELRDKCIAWCEEYEEKAAFHKSLVAWKIAELRNEVLIRDALWNDEYPFYNNTIINNEEIIQNSTKILKEEVKICFFNKLSYKDEETKDTEVCVRSDEKCEEQGVEYPENVEVNNRLVSKVIVEDIKIDEYRGDDGVKQIDSFESEQPRHGLRECTFEIAEDDSCELKNQQDGKLSDIPDDDPMDELDFSSVADDDLIGKLAFELDNMLKYNEETIYFEPLIKDSYNLSRDFDITGVKVDVKLYTCTDQHVPSPLERFNFANLANDATDEHVFDRIDRHVSFIEDTGVTEPDRIGRENLEDDIKASSDMQSDDDESIVAYKNKFIPFHDFDFGASYFNPKARRFQFLFSTYGVFKFILYVTAFFPSTVLSQFLMGNTVMKLPQDEMNYLRYGVRSDGGCSSSFLRDRHHINDDFNMTGVVYFQDKKKIWEVKHWSYEI